MTPPCMIFAAGFGTRMGALTADRPKPLIPVAGKPLLDHALALTDSAGIKSTVINTHYKADQIAAHVADRPGIQLSHEEPEILETGGGLRHALPLLGPDPVLTLNSDAIWLGPNPLNLLMAAWNPDQMDALLILIPKPAAMGHSGKGDFVMSETGQLSRGPGAIYGGAQLIKTTGLAQIPEQAFSLNLLWDQMLQNHRLFGLTYPGTWCDVGRPEGIKLAESMLHVRP